MMTQGEVNKLFSLLLAFYPHSANAGGEQTRIAWYMALQEYTYEELRETALRYAAKEKYFPQLSELLSYMPYEKKSNAWMDKYVNPSLEGPIARYAREHGITWQEARLEMQRQAGKN